MKKLPAIIFILCASFTLVAQNNYEMYSYGYNNYIEKFIDIPVIRNIHGGTIINVNNEGDQWDNEKKETFEYTP